MLQHSPKSAPCSRVLIVVPTPLTHHQLLRTICQVNCYVQVTVVSSVDGSLLGGAFVTGSFSSVLRKTGWPYSTSATAGTSGAALGVAAFKSNSLSSLKGNGCGFAVTNVQLGGYQLDPNAQLVGPTVTWP